MLGRGKKHFPFFVSNKLMISSQAIYLANDKYYVLYDIRASFYEKLNCSNMRCVTRRRLWTLPLRNGTLTFAPLDS